MHVYPYTYVSTLPPYSIDLLCNLAGSRCGASRCHSLLITYLCLLCEANKLTNQSTNQPVYICWPGFLQVRRNKTHLAAAKLYVLHIFLFALKKSIHGVFINIYLFVWKCMCFGFHIHTYVFWLLFILSKPFHLHVNLSCIF